MDETGCGCGNGYCGEGEDEVNCPSDCARFLSEKEESWFSVWIIAILVVFIISYQYAKYRRFAHPHLKRLVDHIKTNYEMKLR